MLGQVYTKYTNLYMDLYPTEKNYSLRLSTDAIVVDPMHTLDKNLKILDYMKQT
jgi:hypothetical protein